LLPIRTPEEVAEERPNAELCGEINSLELPV
jgi:hypothetical protein